MGYGVALDTTSIVHIRTNRSIYIVAEDRPAVKRPTIFAAFDGSVTLATHAADRGPWSNWLLAFEGIVKNLSRWSWIGRFIEWLFRWIAILVLLLPVLYILCYDITLYEWGFLWVCKR